MLHISAVIHPHIDPIISIPLSILSWFATLLFVLIAIGVLLAVATFVVLRMLRRNKRGSEGDVSKSIDVTQNILGRSVPRYSVAQFTDGIHAPIDGFRFMNVHSWKDCWKFAVAPAICSLLASAIALAGLIAILVGSVGPVHQLFEPTYLSRAMEAGAFVLIFLLSAGLAFGFWLLMQTLFCSYFYSKLTLQIEKLLDTPREQLEEANIVAQTTDDVRSILNFLFIQGGLLLTNVIPGLGALVSAGGGFYFSALFAGAEFQDYPLIARGVRLKDRRRFAKQHRFHTLGLGTATVALALIPGIGAVLLSCSVVGAVLQFHRLTSGGHWSNPDQVPVT